MTLRQGFLKTILPVIFVLSAGFMTTACERKMPDTGNEPESSPKPQVQLPASQQRPTFRRNSNRTVLVLVRQIHAPARIRC